MFKWLYFLYSLSLPPGHGQCLPCSLGWALHDQIFEQILKSWRMSSTAKNASGSCWINTPQLPHILPVLSEDICICEPYSLCYSDVAQQLWNWPLSFWGQYSGMKLKIIEEIGVLVIQVGFFWAASPPNCIWCIPSLVCVIYFNDKCIFNSGYLCFSLKWWQLSTAEPLWLSIGAANQGPKR